MKFNLTVVLCLVFIIAGCKTREDIARENLVNDMNTQMKDSQQLNANFTVRLQNLEDRINNVSGTIEENQHNTKLTIDSRILSLEEKIKVIEETQNSQGEKLNKVQSTLDAQKKYLDEVLGTLKSLRKKSSSSTKKRSPYYQAMHDYGKGRYKSARKQLLVLLNDKNYKGDKKARIIHNLGMIAYMFKNNDKSLAYFSRLFTQYPKSGYNKNGLLYLAKTFERENKKEEAKQTLTELVNRFPKAKQVPKAKKMLGSL